MLISKRIRLKPKDLQLNLQIKLEASPCFCYFSSPHLLRYLLDYPVHVKSLSRCLSAPPTATVCCQYHLSVFFEEFSHVGSNKPPFKDLAALIKVLETVPDTIIMSHKFLHYKILSAEYHLICNLLCSHVHKQKMPSLVRTAG